MPDQPRYYINDTGTGNIVNLSHPRVLQMVTDSLRYWVDEMHVDGFRFDLAIDPVREPHGFDQGGGFLDSCRQDPVLSKVKLIAEPWDIGPGGYQAGQFPPGWAEWNDKYRDTVRAWKGDEGKAPGARRAADGLRRYLQPPRPQTLGERQLHHRARRLHAQRSRFRIQRQAQREEWGRQSRRPLEQPVMELRRRRADGQCRDSRTA